MDDMNADCDQCGKRTHVFWEDPVDTFIDYLRLSRKFADKIYVITQFSWIRRTVFTEQVFGNEMEA